jgi:two-component system phosphate regulon response regulator PhoB
MVSSPNEFAGKRILVVDDETDVTELLQYKLEQEDYTVKTVNNPLEVMSVASQFLPDLIILDIMMPELSGHQICRMIRSDLKLKSIAIIFLTARGEAVDRVQGLEYGADDYVPKPFNTKELLLRIRAIFNRLSSGKEPAPRQITIGPLLLDRDLHEVTRLGKVIILTATEFRLLRLLMENKDKVLSREDLLLRVWNYEGNIETRTVDTHVRRLRDKLEDHADMIQTIRGVGYKLIEME